MSAKTTAKSRSRKSKSLLANIMELASMTFWGRVLIGVLIAAALTAINILLSNNDFDLFYLMAGVEMVIAAIVVWIRFLLRKDR